MPYNLVSSIRLYCLYRRKHLPCICVVWFTSLLSLLLFWVIIALLRCSVVATSACMFTNNIYFLLKLQIFVCSAYARCSNSILVVLSVHLSPLVLLHSPSIGKNQPTFRTSSFHRFASIYYPPLSNKNILFHNFSAMLVTSFFVVELNELLCIDYFVLCLLFGVVWCFVLDFEFVRLYEYFSFPYVNRGHNEISFVTADDVVVFTKFRK